jgi:hypothetical protein
MSAGDITVQKADDATIALVLTSPDGTPYDATGSTLTLTVKKNATATPVITKTVGNFTSGGSHASIALSHTDLDIPVRVWRYELLIDGSGNRKSSGLNSFYVTESNGQPGSTVGVVVGAAQPRSTWP